MTTFRQLLDQFEESAKTRTAKGRVFERFCEAFFRTDPLWSERFDAVWSWTDWPDRGTRGDTGIDLVAREAGTGRLVAIQCKFYSPDAVLSWGHVSTFSGMLAQPEFAEGMVVSTAGAESSNVHTNLERHPKRVVFWRVDDFEESRVDWSQFRIDRPAELALRDPKALRPHQEKAIGAVTEEFDLHDRGQLIMACGTGKTFTSLRLAEQMVGAGGSVLFLVPSINLLSQAVLAWANDAVVPLASFAVCSDTKAGVRTTDEDMSANDLAFPASTDAPALVDQVQARATPGHMTAVFSTYQSIDVITQAQQQHGLDEFDLIICDEAHRTTGAFKETGEQSPFTKVHDDAFVNGAHRLYMTATPRIYGDQTKAKAAKADVIVASMDDESCFGPVFHELPFGDAVAQKLLTDYKVLVLAVNEDAVSAAFQRQFETADGELALDDMAKIVGCWHGLSKRGPQFADDNVPMRRAVAFSSTIKQSKAFAKTFPAVVNQALEDRSDANAVKVETDHVDGSTNVKVRSEAIAWLEEPPGQRVCRVLSNAKCLTEGVDVPALDAVLFLQPRKSIVDVVQAVGRVMRLNEGKDFGYVILPIGIPSGVAPEDALRDSAKYQVVWQVLQALRSHDERLAAEINKIDINGRSSKIEVIGIGIAGGDDPADPGVVTAATQGDETTLELPDLKDWCDALYARIVQKVGDRRYMETWAADISAIAAAQETRIRTLLDHPDQNPEAVQRFETFLTALRDNLNDGVTRDDAIGMLSQHLITRPVFEALFGGDEFTKQNPVSQVMQAMVDTLDAANLQAETATLEGFYNHIRMLIGGIDTAEGRQRVITELYEKFFKKALPKTAESLGIVYTPIEIVDFINQAVDDLLRLHFDGTTISDEGVHVLDPFTGTGTFIARLLQSGLIRPEDLQRKYRGELHANEVMLLAYYIAAINIETAYEGVTSRNGQLGEYRPFEGIVLTDTFQMSEEGDSMDHLFFPRNNARADRQKTLDIRVILGNPPYSVGQTSQNDANQNLKYPSLDRSIEKTYAKQSNAGSTRSLYDSYFRAYRWASNRIAASADGGIVAYVSNGGWLDDNAADGVRRSLQREYHHIYIFNLRGNQRTGGELSRREGGKVFGSGSRNTVTIALLVKEPGEVTADAAQIHYRDIGDYLTASQKLAIVGEARLASLGWRLVSPNEDADWIHARDPRFSALLPLDTSETDSIFVDSSLGVVTNRDPWVYASSRKTLQDRIASRIDFLNLEARRVAESVQDGRAGDQATISQVVDRDPQTYSWTDDDFRRIARGETWSLDRLRFTEASYRPFFKQHLALGRQVNKRPAKIPSLYPGSGEGNIGFSLTDSGNTAPLFALASVLAPDLCFAGDKHSRHFTRWRYEEAGPDSLLGAPGEGPTRRSNLNPAGVRRFRDALGKDITDDDVFAYVYAILHSAEYRKTFAVNLKKEAPRVPLVTDRADLDAFVVAGQYLLDLHVGYDEVEPYPLVEHWTPGSDDGAEPQVLLVGDRKMRYPKVVDQVTGEKVADKSRLIYNDHLTLSGIPLSAHDYVLGTRSGVDWIIDRWYVKTDKASGIVNDVNQWGLEKGNPRYIIDLIKRVVTVSMRTVEIVEGLPKLTF